jgi:hypothetical protein
MKEQSREERRIHSELVNELRRLEEIVEETTRERRLVFGSWLLTAFGALISIYVWHDEVGWSSFTQGSLVSAGLVAMLVVQLILTVTFYYPKWRRDKLQRRLDAMNKTYDGKK